MIIDDEQRVTEAVLAAMARTPDRRFRELMDACVRHVHAFVREVEPTEDEFAQAVEFVIALGRLSNQAHNEVVLLCDTLGISTLACLLRQRKAQPGATPATLLGPFFRANAPLTANGGSIVRGATPGCPLYIEGHVSDLEDRPIAGAAVDIWQASPAGLYENQAVDQAEMNLRGRLITDDQGGFALRTVMPAGYPVPTQGVVGAMLRKQARHPYRPAHVHCVVHRPGWRTLVTQLFVAEDDYLESDVAFGVVRRLVGDFQRHESEPAPDADVSGPWYSLQCRFALEPGDAQMPRAPIA